jgi:hypothetical protein
MMFLNWECPAMRSLFGIDQDFLGKRRGVIGRASAKIKDLALARPDFDT